MISIEIFIVLSEVFLLFIWLTWCLCPGLSWTQGCCTCWCRWYRSPQGLVHGSRFFQKILVFPFCAQITKKPSFWLKIWPLGHCCCCLKSFFLWIQPPTEHILGRNYTHACRIEDPHLGGDDVPIPNLLHVVVLGGGVGVRLGLEKSVQDASDNIFKYY